MAKTNFSATIHLITVQQWLLQAEKKLLPFTAAAQQDAHIILSHVLNKPNLYLMTNAQTVLSPKPLQQANTLLADCMQGIPLAYLLGHTEFYGLSFQVNKHVLIPRSATECLVDWTLHHFDDTPLNVIDLGTGSGAIACTLAEHRPQWTITAVDICEDALQVARINSDKLHLKKPIQFQKSSWLQGFDGNTFDLIITNPPYIDKYDYHIDDSVRYHEPEKALFSNNQGLEDIQTIIEQAKSCLQKSGTLMIEHGHLQQKKVIDLLKQANYQSIQGHQDLSKHDRFVTAML